MSLSLTPASEYDTPFLADLLTRSFEGYFVPIVLNSTALLNMIRRDGIDLTASRVLIRDGEPVGLALIARRGWTSRLAAMGITINARSGGVGTWAMNQLIEEAKSRGEKEILLEVIEQNTAGVKLYEKVGFTKMRRLIGYKLDTTQFVPDDDEEEHGQLEEIDIYELAKLVTQFGLNDLPWQLSGATLIQQTPPARAFHFNDAYCLISNPEATDVAIQSVLVKPESRGAGLSGVLMRTLFAQFPNRIWHVSAILPEELGFVFEQVGMLRETLSQWQMSRAL